MKPNILFIGDLNFYAKGFSRLQAAQRLGCHVDAFSHTPIGGDDLGFINRSLSFRLAWKLNFQLDTEKINERIIAYFSKNSPDILWIEKGNMIRRKTLQIVRKVSPKTIIVSYSDDDMYNPTNRTKSYANTIKYYH